jgi:hypothetical protein
LGRRTPSGHPHSDGAFAVYRRALAPIMTFNGVLGVAAGVIGWAAEN